MLARTHKDLALAAGDAEGRSAHLKAAFDLYDEAYRRVESAGRRAPRPTTRASTPRRWRSCAATGSRRARLARRGARDLRGRDRARERGSATTGRARRSPRRRSSSASGTRPRPSTRPPPRLAGSRHGDLASTRRQARLVLAHTGADDAWLARVLAIPPVLVYTGHMVSPRGPAKRRLPCGTSRRPCARRSASASSASGRWRPTAPPRAAPTSSASRRCRRVGGETHVTLPFPPAEFRKVSVDIGARDGASASTACSPPPTASSVASDHPAEGSLSGFEYANLVLTGAGRLRAQVLGTPLVGLAVWDGAPGARARRHGRRGPALAGAGIAVEHVDVRRSERRARRPTGGAGARARGPSAAAPAGFTHEIKAMLFADAVGYSKMTENQIPIFIRALPRLRGGAQRAHRPPPDLHADRRRRPVLRLPRHVRRGPLRARAQPARARDRLAGARPAADARPAHRPALRADLLLRATRSRSSRSTPGPTPAARPASSRSRRPGQVYTSSAFAAVAAATGVDDLGFSYIGRIPLAKHYGSLALYHVRPAD